MWEKGVQYQFYHTLALIVCAIYLKTEDSKLIRNAAYCFVLGILFFSGSLYLLATRELTGIPTIILGPITPSWWVLFYRWVGVDFSECTKERLSRISLRLCLIKNDTSANRYI
jgi:uncharacterized membrane protein YgdD (TMEM256/DUF423 family)